jgi:hypothetical protein
VNQAEKATSLSSEVSSQIQEILGLDTLVVGAGARVSLSSVRLVSAVDKGGKRRTLSKKFESSKPGYSMPGREPIATPPKLPVGADNTVGITIVIVCSGNL